MLKKTITYSDYNGADRTEDFYFNLSMAEVTEMQLSTSGGYAAMIERLVAAQDMPAIFKEFKDLIFKSYGIKSPDGKRFIKSSELSTEFMQTEAYSVLLTEISTNAEKAADFVNGVLPKASNK